DELQVLEFLEFLAVEIVHGGEFDVVRIADLGPHAHVELGHEPLELGGEVRGAAREGAKKQSHGKSRRYRWVDYRTEVRPASSNNRIGLPSSQPWMFSMICCACCAWVRRTALPMCGWITTLSRARI